MRDDFLAPSCGVRGSRCKTEVWQKSVARRDLPFGSFRWSEKALHGTPIQRKRVIGTVERLSAIKMRQLAAAVTVLLGEMNSDKLRMGSHSITVAQFCDHFEQRELAKDNTWRSHATKKTYLAYLTRWVLPHRRKYELAEIRTVQVESWLRGLHLAKGSCAKIRGLMSVPFNHACRYELFDRNLMNLIYLVRQSAKCRRAPTVLMPVEIKALVDNLSSRERTLPQAGRRGWRSRPILSGPEAKRNPRTGRNGGYRVCTLVRAIAGRT